MDADRFTSIFTSDKLAAIFPADRADRFFDALLGDSSEGAYDIALRYAGAREDELHFEFQLQERPGKCLSCSLTYGLPHVFSRHPVINISSVVKDIDHMLDGQGRCGDWRVEATREAGRKVHVIPLIIDLKPDGA
ncbi:MAG: pancreas/duodenum homeobox protein 1 [Desulfobacterales bacterium]|nr:pancreas/duodenum homeobox protein 1 [Desulfobacterales bacterium]